MRAGELRHRLELQTSADSQDAGGGLIEVWTTEATVWGSVSPLRGAEKVNAQLINSEITHSIKIRYRPGVNAQGRILFGSRAFQLFEVLNLDERNREIQIGAMEVLP